MQRSLLRACVERAVCYSVRRQHVRARRCQCRQTAIPRVASCRSRITTKMSCMSSMPGQFGTTPGHAVSQPPAPRAFRLTLAQRLAPMVTAAQPPLRSASRLGARAQQKSSGTAPRRQRNMSGLIRVCIVSLGRTLLRGVQRTAWLALSGRRRLQAVQLCWRRPRHGRRPSHGLPRKLVFLLEAHE